MCCYARWERIHILFLISSSYREKVQYICSGSLKRKSNKTLSGFCMKYYTTKRMSQCGFSLLFSVITVFSQPVLAKKTPNYKVHESIVIQVVLLGTCLLAKKKYIYILYVNHGKNLDSFSLLNVLLYICYHLWNTWSYFIQLKSNSEYCVYIKILKLILQNLEELEESKLVFNI